MKIELTLESVESIVAQSMAKDIKWSEDENVVEAAKIILAYYTTKDEYDRIINEINSEV